MCGIIYLSTVGLTEGIFSYSWQKILNCRIQEAMVQVSEVPDSLGIWTTGSSLDSASTLLY